MPEEIPEESVGGEFLRLATADNFRDVVGEGLTTADGVPLRRGVLYRCNELRLSHVDAGTVAGLGITEVFDLRTHEEVAAHPDVPIGDATWIHCPVPQFDPDAALAMPDADAMRAGILEIYRDFVTDGRCQAAFGAVLRSLAATTTPQLFHCTAGKDRTGWVAYLLHHVAGVAPRDAEREYLMSNDYSAGTRAKYLTLVAEHLGEERVPVFEPTMVVDLAYLEAAREQARVTYGDLDTYLSEGLGVGAEDRRSLRSRLVAEDAS